MVIAPEYARVVTTVEAAAARALVDAGLVVVDLSAARVVVSLRDRLAEVGLGSLRRVLALAPADQHDLRVAAWASAVTASLAGVPPAGDVRQRLVPRLLGQADRRLFTTALAPGLHLALAEDLPLRQRLLTPFDLPRLGLGMTEARQAAMANLVALTPQPEEVPGAWQWTVGDGLDAARLLLSGSWQPDTLGALAVAPARDLCWWVPVHTAADIEAGVALALRAQQLGDLPYPLSTTLWWVPSGAGELAPVTLAPDTLAPDGARLRVGVPDDLARRLM